MIENSKTIELRILGLIINEFKVSEYDLISWTRKRSVVDARRAWGYFLKKETDYTLEKIGSIIGGKDHATILYYVRTAEALIETDKDFKRKVLNVETGLKIPLTDKVDWRAVVGCLHISNSSLSGECVNDNIILLNN